MKEVFVNLRIERGLFGYPKSYEKQGFETTLYRFMPDKKEYGDNFNTVKEAFDAALAMLFAVWITPNQLKRVHGNVRVLITFSEDYSTWQVDMAPYGIHLQEKHKDFDSYIAQEENKIFEKYGFVKPPEKFEVSFRGRKSIMNKEQLNEFHKEMVNSHPGTWAELYVARTLEQ